MNEQYYINVNGEQQGPFTYEKVQALLCIGEIPEDALLWKEGMETWIPVSQYKAEQEQPKVVPPPLPTTTAPAVQAPSAQKPAAPAPEAQGPGQTSYSFGQAIGSCFRRYACFQGRACASEFWWFFLFSFLVGFFTGGITGGLSGFVTLLPSLAVGWRRMHDIGRPGWFSLSPIYSLYLATLPSTEANAFGAAAAKPDETI